jgi:hypothetical protein
MKRIPLQNHPWGGRRIYKKSNKKLIIPIDKQRAKAKGYITSK